MFPMKVIFSCIVYSFLMAMSSYSQSWLIIANGQERPLRVLEEKAEGRSVLVLDGACNRLEGGSFLPNFILGDFDSVENPEYWGIKETFSALGPDATPYEGRFSITIVPAKNQDLTDLDKGLSFCESMGADSILVLQAHGSRMDHTLANIGLLRKHYRPDRLLILETEDEQLFYVKDARVLLQGPIGAACAVVGCSTALMTSEGLAYNGENYLLDFGVQGSTSNALSAEEASIAIQGEALFIVAHSVRFSIETME